MGRATWPAVIFCEEQLLFPTRRFRHLQKSRETFSFVTLKTAAPSPEVWKEVSQSSVQKMRNSPPPQTNNNKRSSSSTTPCCSKVGLKRGPWTSDEDDILVTYITNEGEGRWRTLPKRAGLLRCGKSCRLRWMNYLRPSVKRGKIKEDEEDLILRLHRLLGNRWSLIAGRIPGRTDNEIKNYWNTHISKKLISQGIDPRTHKPIPIDDFTSVAIDARASSSSKEEEECPNPKISFQYSTSSNTNMLNRSCHDHHGGYDGDILNNDDVFSLFLNSFITDQEGEHQLQQQTHQAVLQETDVDDPLLLIPASSFGCSNIPGMVDLDRRLH